MTDNPIPTTFTDFMSQMRSLCAPYGANMPKFERACEAMWFDGIFGSGHLQKTSGASRPTVIKWANAAKSLGLRPKQVRPRSAAHAKEARKKLEKPTFTSTEERRAYYAALLDEQIEANKANPRELTTLISQQSSLIPGLKAPETRLDIQMVIGRDSTTQIESGLTENLRWLLDNDRAFANRILSQLGLSAPEVADAQIVDDEPDADAPALPESDGS